MNRTRPKGFTDGSIEVRPGERGADATLVLNFGEAGVVEAMDITFQPRGDTARGMGLLTEMVEGANALMQLSKSSGGGVDDADHASTRISDGHRPADPRGRGPMGAARHQRSRDGGRDRG